ncbi:MAG: NAD(P)-binding domain-containing protein [Planctomycetes bacterium]|nr:NAD(P)-binding domain-containing protein [Planctomycetota bacterium]
MKVAVLGAGNGGQAMAADLTLGGHEVRLAAVPGHASNLRVINAFGGIYVEGVTSSGKPPGLAKMAMVTDDVPKAIKGAEVVMVVIPAFAQESYFPYLVEHTEPGQIVVFNPGKFGALTFAKILKEAGRDDLIVGETASLIYATKMKGQGHINIKAVKSELPFATLPSRKTAGALWTLTDLFPQFSPAYNVFQTSVNDPAIIVHTVSTLLNASRIEQMGPYRNAHYDITPSVGRVIEALDAERVAIAKALCVETYSLLETAQIMYKVKGSNVYEAEMQIAAHNIQMSPNGLKHRYITEELPYGLVPVSSIAKAAGIPTPGIDAVINIGAMANGEDYWTTGLTLEKLGLSGLGIRELVHYVTYGTPS